MTQRKSTADKQKERRKKQVWGIVRSLLFLGGLVAIALWMNRSRPPEVLSVLPATALDDQYQPLEVTDTFGPDDTFFVSVELRGYRSDMALSARWLYEGELITETTLETANTGEGYAGFVLVNEAPPWPQGKYRVEIVYQDDVLGSAAFTVE